MGNKVLEPAHSEAHRSVPAGTAAILRALLIIASVLFIVGIFTPMLTLSQFIFIQNSFSVYSGVVELLRNGQIVLFLIVAAFSIILPILKILILFRLLAIIPSNSHRLRRYLQLMHDYGRWAMLDVMVVAVLIVTVKLGAIASISVHYGLYLFGAAVLLIMLVTHKIVRLTDSTQGRTDKTGGDNAR